MQSPVGINSLIKKVTEHESKIQLENNEKIARIQLRKDLKARLKEYKDKIDVATTVAALKPILKDLAKDVHLLSKETFIEE
jgi:hypothetical protein